MSVDLEGSAIQPISVAWDMPKNGMQWPGMPGNVEPPKPLAVETIDHVLHKNALSPPKPSVATAYMPASPGSPHVAKPAKNKASFLKMGGSGRKLRRQSPGKTGGQK